MNKQLLTLLMFAMILVSMASVSAVTNITDCTGWLAITDANEYALINDIDCGGNTFPACDYGGWTTNITGNNYTISGLVVTECMFDIDTGSIVEDLNFDNLTINGDFEYSGLFEQVQSGAILRNVHITDIKVYGAGYGTEYSGSLVEHIVGGGLVDNCGVEGYVEAIGGLVGQNDGLIRNSYFNGTLNATQSTISGTQSGLVGLAGGLAGWNFGAIESSYVIADVYGTNNTGGLVGESYGYGAGGTIGNVSNSYFIGNVYGDNYVGGLVGSLQTNGANTYGVAENSYAVASVTGNADVGALIGAGNGTCSNAFYNSEVGGNTSYCGTGKTTAEMIDITTYSSWDIADYDNFTTEYWFIDDGYDYPRLSFMYSAYSPYVPPVVPEQPSPYIQGSGTIYEVMNSGGAGLGVFLQYLGASIPILVIGLLIVVVIASIGYAIANVIKGGFKTTTK